MAEPAVILVECEPPPEVSPNWRGHWRQKAGGARMFRALACIATNRVYADALQVVSESGRVVIDAEIRWSGRRKIHDDDNAWAMLKSARDGVADALGIDDSIFAQGDLTQTRGEGVTVLTLRESE